MFKVQIYFPQPSTHSHGLSHTDVCSQRNGANRMGPLIKKAHRIRVPPGPQPPFPTEAEGEDERERNPGFRTACPKVPNCPPPKPRRKRESPKGSKWNNAQKRLSAWRSQEGSRTERRLTQSTKCGATWSRGRKSASLGRGRGSGCFSARHGTALHESLRFARLPVGL